MHFYATIKIQSQLGLCDLYLNYDFFDADNAMHFYAIFVTFFFLKGRIFFVKHFYSQSMIIKHFNSVLSPCREFMAKQLYLYVVMQQNKSEQSSKGFVKTTVDLKDIIAHLMLPLFPVFGRGRQRPRLHFFLILHTKNISWEEVTTTITISPSRSQDAEADHIHSLLE